MFMQSKVRKIDALYSLCEEFFYAHKMMQDPNENSSYWESECERIYDEITSKETKHFLNVAQVLDKHLPPDGEIGGEREKLRMRLLFDITNL